MSGRGLLPEDRAGEVRELGSHSSEEVIAANRANDRSPHERSDMRVGFKTGSGFKTGLAPDIASLIRATADPGYILAARRRVMPSANPPYGRRPHTCATVYIVKAVCGLDKCCRQSVRLAFSSSSLMSPSLRIVLRSNSTVEGR